MRLFPKILLGILIVLAVLVVVMHVRATNQRETEEQYLATLKKTLVVSSRSFPPNGDMPVNCSCRGDEKSPALLWETAQPGVESYAVLMTDYDVPTPVFPIFNLSHWVVYDLPASVRSLPEGVTTEQMRLLGGKTGKNSTGTLKYIGPCPPLGRHAYWFRVYALDRMLQFSTLPDKQAIIDTLQGHVLGYGELKGYFQ